MDMARKQKKAPGASTIDSRIADIAHAPPERWQRGSEFALVGMDGDGPRKVQRIHDGVGQLYAANRIGDAEVAAAARWVKDYERHLRSPFIEPATAGIRGGGGNGPELVLSGGIDASWRREEAAVAVGPVGVQLLLAFVAHGLSPRAVAQALGISSGRGRGTTALSAELVRTLYALSAHYAYADRHGYRGILDPARRPQERTRELTAAERMPA